jgi:hypothetical protein
MTKTSSAGQAAAMVFDHSGAKRRLLARRPPSFVDPLTGYRPEFEDQLSTLLALFHQEGKIDWNRVCLYSADNRRLEEKADVLFSNGTSVVSEYRLFWESDSEKNMWGQKRPDFFFLSRDHEAVVLVENKIESGGTRTAAQFAEYADFLIHISSRIQRRGLVILSGGEFFEAGWYANQLMRVLDEKQRGRTVNGYLMRWEDVFGAFQ